MHKIKTKPFNPAKYRVPKNAEFVYFYPIEYATLTQEQADEYSFAEAKKRMWARLRGETSTPALDYLGDYHD